MGFETARRPRIEGQYEFSAAYYDALHRARGKDYAEETKRLTELILTYKPDAQTLLNVGAGTGRHDQHFRDVFAVEGLDIDDRMLAIAQSRNPSIPYHRGSMIDFDLQRQFDAITCLFSVISYTQTPENLRLAAATMGRHLTPGGVVIIEPWMTPEQYIPGKAWMDVVNEPDLKLVRMNTSQRDGNIAVQDFHYMVATPNGVQHFEESHQMGLFTTNEQIAALQDAGLYVDHDPYGLSGRGLLIGVKPFPNER